MKQYEQLLANAIKINANSKEKLETSSTSLILKSLVKIKEYTPISYTSECLFGIVR